MPLDRVLEHLPQVIKVIGASPFVLIVESYNQKTGVSSPEIHCLSSLRVTSFASSLVPSMGPGYWSVG